MPSPQKKRSRPAGEPGGDGNGKGCWLDTFISHELCPLQANCHAYPYCRLACPLRLEAGGDAA